MDMDVRNMSPCAPPSIHTGMDYSEELLAEVDEPPEHRLKENLLLSWSPPKFQTTFGKAVPNIFARRESLLTLQLHSEADRTDDDDEFASTNPSRTLSTQSTWSVASTAELTSDDGHSVPSPAISPPLPPTAVTAAIPITEKSLTPEPKIVGQDDLTASKQTVASSEQSVEAGLGRKRCISFACGGKNKQSPTSQPAEPQAPPQAAASASPPKRKCMLKFVCPTRANSNDKPIEKAVPSIKRPVSPPPPVRRSNTARSDELRTHRGSDSTVIHTSPKSTRRSPSVIKLSQKPSSSTTTLTPLRKMSIDSDASTEATRFHAFGTSDDEPEEWVQESTCHRSRLTVNDTLKKENVIRKACEEVEEEAVEEDEDEEEAIDNGLDDDRFDDELDEDEDRDGEDEYGDDDELSDDEGFYTDDEGGFAESDSESEDSDEEWWRPGGASTAATSIEPMDRMISRNKSTDVTAASSLGSLSSGRLSPRNSGSRRRHRKHNAAIPIQNLLATSDLPDSTDFVCGTLDEDRPLEQAYINNIKQREAAKHVPRPQDIDPTFPTSDPEMDEEDDEDLVDPSASENEAFMHGDLEELDGDLTARRRPSPRPRAKGAAARSPPPPARHRSPAPPKRSQQQHLARSPAPCRRRMARSPAPCKLGASPTPASRVTSPSSSRRPSLITAQQLDEVHEGFAQTSNATHTASLPRCGGFKLSRLNTTHLDDEADTDETSPMEKDRLDSPILPKRGAIDIVKGLERKRQRRKDRLLAKACAKAAAKGEKAYKVKPGKGAERMREVGLELQRYHGKGEHILSM